MLKRRPRSMGILPHPVAKFFVTKQLTYSEKPELCISPENYSISSCDGQKNGRTDGQTDRITFNKTQPKQKYARKIAKL